MGNKLADIIDQILNWGKSDIKIIFTSFLVFTFAGIGTTVLRFINSCSYSSVAAAILWSLAFLIAGIIVGFLFGIPPVKDESKDESKDSAKVGDNAHANVNNNEKKSSSLGVNTSLQQISEWFTKIIVGIGLVNLKVIPQHINSAADVIARGLTLPIDCYKDILTETNRAMLADTRITISQYIFLQNQSIAVAIIIYFSGVGIFFGYLITRLYFSGAFVRADKELYQGVNLTDAALLEPTRIDLEDFRINKRIPQLSTAVQKVVKKVSDVSLEKMNKLPDIKVWAKAQLLNNSPTQALAGYEKAIATSPSDIEAKIDYAKTLAYASRPDAEVVRELESAYSQMQLGIDKNTKKELYKSLTFYALYLPPPDGYEKVIKYCEEYIADASNIPSSRIWLNLCCAYGQKAKDVKTAENERLFEELRQKVIHGIKETLKIRPTRKQMIINVLEGKSEDENDLVVFKHDEDVKKALGYI